jgi:DNA repair exonuclease SbcCD ATPase subunit
MKYIKYIARSLTFFIGMHSCLFAALSPNQVAQIKKRIDTILKTPDNQMFVGWDQQAYQIINELKQGGSQLQKTTADYTRQAELKYLKWMQQPRAPQPGPIPVQPQPVPADQLQPSRRPRSQSAGNPLRVLGPLLGAAAAAAGGFAAGLAANGNADRELNALRERNTALLREIERLQAQVAQAGTNQENLQQVASRINQELAEARQNLVALQRDAAALQAAERNAQQQIQNANDQIIALQQQVRALEAEAAQVPAPQAQIQNLNNQIDQLDVRRGDLVAAQRQLQRADEGLNNEIVRLQFNVAALDMLLKLKDVTIQAAKSGTDTLRKQLRDQEIELNQKIQKEKMLRELERKNALKELQRQQQVNNELIQQLNVLRESLANAQITQSGLEQKLVRAREVLNNYEKSIQVQYHMIFEHQSELRVKDKELFVLQNNFNLVMKRLNDARADIAILNEKLKQKTASQSDMDRGNQELKEAQEAIVQLQQQMATLTQEKKVLEAELIMERQTREQLERSLQESSVQINSLQQELEDIENFRLNMLRKVKDLQASQKSKDSKIKELEQQIVEQRLEEEKAMNLASEIADSLDAKVKALREALAANTTLRQEKINISAALQEAQNAFKDLAQSMEEQSANIIAMFSQRNKELLEEMAQKETEAETTAQKLNLKLERARQLIQDQAQSIKKLEGTIGKQVQLSTKLNNLINYYLKNEKKPNPDFDKEMIELLTRLTSQIHTMQQEQMLSIPRKK